MVQKNIAGSDGQVWFGLVHCHFWLNHDPNHWSGLGISPNLKLDCWFRFGEGPNAELDLKVCPAYIIKKSAHSFCVVYYKSELLGYKLKTNLNLWVDTTTCNMYR